MTSKVTLPIVMLASGVANTVLSKYQDLLAEENGPVKSVAIFQSLNIFMGEACLWFYVIWNRWKNRFGYAPVKPLTTGQKMSMAIPAFMDICGSTLMNVGLLFTSASVYQMTRGSLIIFVALFSMLFLQKRLTLQRWLCLAFVVLGVAIVGYSGSSVNAGVDPTLGLVAILVGQMFLATQFTVEEYLLSSIDIEPNEVVAYEGTFGVIFVLIIMVVSYIFVGRTPEGKNGWFDFTHVFHRFNEEPMLYVISGVILISIAFFNALV
ncbi:NST UDP-galactose transporter [Schizosaccharomyces japonicus yFS275]|uniref:NST UDP-galactose transporter n=1 Tax=Schizosaccharomyces japonicus (strain yFS275 / FY16936) TaxID=402676 RepID=B6JZY8_SCHJY|nr:NST UDP-galactose transporter [Schizosaccharomyces japonicus yFS275]EEB06138.2 NST UDP-galactose transporter [Schizosaccharomyces japonicus yFS275]